MTTFAGEVPNLTTIAERWAPSYKYAVDAVNRSMKAIATSTFTDYTGQPSVTIPVTSTGVLMVQWGFEGYNNASMASSIRLGIAMTGANTTVPSTNFTAMASNNGVVNAAAAFSTSRMHLYAGLTPGSTVVKVQAYISSTPVAPEDAILSNAWLLVSQYY